MNSVKRYIYTAEVTRIVDGDTIDCRLSLTADIGFHIESTATTVQRIRIIGVDTPEPRPRLTSRWRATHTRDEEKQLAAQATLFTAAWCAAVVDKLGATISVETHKSDNFGRYLGEFYYHDNLGNRHSLGDALLAEGLAMEYS